MYIQNTALFLVAKHVIVLKVIIDIKMLNIVKLNMIICENNCDKLFHLGTNTQIHTQISIKFSIAIKQVEKINSIVLSQT